MKKAQVVLLGLLACTLAVPAVAQEPIVINEVLYDTEGYPDEGTFTELKGPADTPLDGYILVGINGNGGVPYDPVPLDTYVIPADGYFVVAGDATVAEADMVSGVDWQNGPDAVELWYVVGSDTTVVDGCCYGQGDQTCEGSAGPDVPAESSTSRCPDGSDTGDNSVDFWADATPTPGAMNDAPCEIPPTPMTVCQIMEVDAAGYPVHFGEYVTIVDPVITLHDNLIYHDSRLEVTVTDGFCCTMLFDYDYPNPYPAGTIFDEVVGTVGFYNGKIQLTDLTFAEAGSGTVPAPYEVTTGELAQYGEQYESCLVWICGLYITSGTWPDEGYWENLTVDDGSGPVTMRIDDDTDIDGTPAPVEPFTAIGVAGQYDSSSPYDSGYQFLPRNVGDIFSGLDCPPPTSVRPSTWGAIKSTYK